MTEKEYAIYEALNEFHEEYLTRVGKPVEMSDIIWGIMDKAYLPMLPKFIEMALTAEALTEQFLGSSLPFSRAFNESTHIKMTPSSYYYPFYY